MTIDLKATTANPVAVRDAVGLPVSVKVYGAVGNGSTDDTTAIESALTAGVGKTIYFPPGTYVIDDATVAGSCHIRGAGMGQTILKVKNSQAAGRYGLNAGGFDDVTISDLTIDGNKANQSTVNREALLLTGARATLRNVEIKNTYSVGVQVYEGTDYLIEGCTFRGCAGNSVQLSKAIRVRVVGCAVSGGGAHGIYLAGTGGHDVTIADNDVWDCDLIGIALGIGHTKVTVSGNTVYGCTDNAIDIGEASQVTVTGNTCHTSRAGILSDAAGGGGDDVVVVGNVVHDISHALANPDGIYLGAATRFTISGNTVYDVKGQGIRLAACVDGVISGNVVMEAGSGSEAAGVLVGGTSDKVLVTNNRIGDRRTPSYPDTMFVSVKVESDATNITVTDNDLRNAYSVANTIVTAGTGHVTRGNLFDSGVGITTLSPYRSNCYSVSACGAETTYQFSTDGEVFWIPLIIPKPLSIDRIAAQVSTAGSAGSVLRLGVYGSTVDGMPGSLIVDGGTVASASTGVKEVTVSQALPPGLCYLSVASQGSAATQPILYAASSSMSHSLPNASATVATRYNVTCWYGFSVTGALPGTASIGDALGTHPKISVRYV